MHPKYIFYVQLVTLIVILIIFCYFDVVFLAASEYLFIPLIGASITIFLFIFSFIFSFVSRESYGSFWWICVYLVIVPSLIVLFAIFYIQFGLQSNGVPVYPAKSRVLYFSTVTFTTLGYGDFTPSPDSRIFSAFEAFLGFTFVPIVLSEIVAFANSKKSNIAERLELLFEINALQNEAMTDIIALQDDLSSCLQKLRALELAKMKIG